MSLKLNPKNFKLNLIRAQDKYTTFKAKVLPTSILRGVEICMVHPIESSQNKRNAKLSLLITEKLKPVYLKVNKV